MSNGDGTYTTAEVEKIIRRVWEVALRAGMQFVRQHHTRGYNIDRLVEEILGNRNEET
jgi:hypothetical protein